MQGEKNIKEKSKGKLMKRIEKAKKSENCALGVKNGVKPRSYKPRYDDQDDDIDVVCRSE